ncbi:MAG TPA: hypothetical protein PKY82_17805 [Pyrinomonadaceae bacterium]|nr:hypothetical protein [Pyrinomonadaceae bacterium]
MDEKLKLGIFITVLFIAIFLTDSLDKFLQPVLDESDWWNLVIAAPILLVMFGTGFLIFHIKSLIKFAFFGAICFFIFISTQIYFTPAEYKEEWNVFGQSWTEIGKYFGLTFAAIFLGVLVVLSIGGIFRYIYNLFFTTIDSELAE